MHKNLKSFLLAMQLLTRIPVSYQFDHHGNDYKALCGRSVLSYPLVGLIIGCTLALVGMVFSHFFTSHYSEFIVAALILIIWAMITGGLHLDGLADSADAWLGGFGDPVRTLEIMKDPRCGAAGVMVLVLVLLLKFVLISAVLSQSENSGLLYLILAPVLARASIPVLFLYTPYARKGGMGSIPAEYMPKGAVKLVLIVLMLVSLLMIKNGFYILLGMGIIFYLLRRMMIRRIGGMTGDTAGATVEIMECTVILFALMDF